MKIEEIKAMTNGKPQKFRILRKTFVPLVQRLVDLRGHEYVKELFEAKGLERFNGSVLENLMSKIAVVSAELNRVEGEIGAAAAIKRAAEAQLRTPSPLVETTDRFLREKGRAVLAELNARQTAPMAPVVKPPTRDERIAAMREQLKTATPIERSRIAERIRAEIESNQPEPGDTIESLRAQLKICKPTEVSRISGKLKVLYKTNR